MNTKKIEAVVATSDIEAVEDALEALGVDSLSISSIVSRSPADILYYRGAAYRAESHRLKVECLVTDQLVASAIETITKAASPSPAAGRICVFDVSDVSLLRTW